MAERTVKGARLKLGLADHTQLATKCVTTVTSHISVNVLKMRCNVNTLYLQQISSLDRNSNRTSMTHRNLIYTVFELVYFIYFEIMQCIFENILNKFSLETQTVTGYTCMYVCMHGCTHAPTYIHTYALVI